MNTSNTRYNHLNDYFKNKFGERTLKICIDGGFSCPNRDGTCGISGCIFCGEQGSGENIKKSYSFENTIDINSNICKSISKQVTDYFASYKATRANKFIAYFQNFSNTYADVKTLKSRYDAALIDDRIVALAVATRPDCITEEIIALLKSYANKYHVFVELGFQTSNDETGKLINRGYSSETFVKAVNLLADKNIEVIAHVMVGLPGETLKDVANTIEFLNHTPISGIKIHSTYVIKNTKLAQMLENKEYTPLTLEEYIKTVIYIIAHLRKDIIIHRISGDAPKDLLLAPSWNLHKKWIINGIEKNLEKNDCWQGKFC
ncbi:MAG: TIGR01212 family radical SAM protein [Clostridia bacterium]|nr:TIGR01212 family radical SAM protein [Clostridia bacterium]